MSTATLDAARPDLPPIPRDVFADRFWRDPDGELREHDYEIPVDKQTRYPNGKVFACIGEFCPTKEWVIEPSTEPKTKFCKDDGGRLTWVPLDAADGHSMAAGKQRQLARVAGWVARKREEKAQRIRASIDRQVQEARRAAGGLATDMRGHVPSLAATAVVQVGVLYVVDLQPALETFAIATAIGACGAVAGYLAVVIGEKYRLTWLAQRDERRGKQPLSPAKISRRVTERSVYTAMAFGGTGLMTGALGLIDALIGLDLTRPLPAALAAMVGIGLGWVVNAAHWGRLWKHRTWVKQEAARKAREAAERAAREAEEAAARAREEERLRNQAAVLVELDLTTAEGQGQRMAIEWERIKGLETARIGFPRIGATRIVPEQTREITAPDPETGKPISLGWEFTGVCEPGALITGQGMAPPIVQAKEWLVSVLDEGRYDPTMISLIDTPDGRQNTFLLMITEKSRLDGVVAWRPGRVRVDHRGRRYGFLGRALTGEDIEELLYNPGQPFGGIVTGQTGGGKGGYANRRIRNLLEARILPLLFDPKTLGDYGDFAGIFPMGWTKRHRRIILTSLTLERERRQSKLTGSPQVNKHGAVVPGGSVWTTHDPVTGEIGVFGEPIESIWDEFHDLSQDPKFIQPFTNHVRLQRSSANGCTLLSQGGGLSDWGDSVLRDLASNTSLTNFRGGDMHSKLVGNRNSKYSTADLPNLPGMCLRQAPGSPDIPLRAAFISRNPQDEDTLFTSLWGKGKEPVLQIEDPMTWISDETKALWETTGLMALWRLARGPGGLDRLLADTQEDEEDEQGQPATTGSTAITSPQPKEVLPGKISARQVLLAVLHDAPGSSREQITAHRFWLQAPGWNGKPNESTITRAANQLDPSVGGTKPLRDGDVQKLDRGPNSSSWRLTAAGEQDGAEMAALMRRVAPAEPNIVPGTAGFNPTALAEAAIQRAAELHQMLAEEQRLLR